MSEVIHVVVDVGHDSDLHSSRIQSKKRMTQTAVVNVPNGR